MATNKVTQRLKNMVSDSQNRGFSGGTNQSISNPSMNLNNYSNRKNYPWLSEQNYKKLEEEVNKLWLKGQERKEAMDQLYQRQIKDFINEQLLDKRADAINEQALQAAELKNGQADAQLRMTQFSQALKRKYKLDATANDYDVFSDFVEWLWEDGVNLAWQYLAWENKKLRYDAGLESWWEKAADFWVWVVQSPWKRGYNMVWQWMDKLWKAAADKLEWTALVEWVRDQAIDAFWEEEVRKFAEQRQKELEEWTAFNGREATDIRTPLLWEERANKGWTKGWEIVGDIATAIALTYSMWAATAPIMANSTALWAGILWGIEWGLDTALTHYGSQWNLDVKPWELALWTVLGSLWGVVTNKVSNLSKEAIKETADKLDDTANATKVAKTTTKIADKTDDANRIAGRIWQWDLDDQAKVVKWVKSITDRKGEKAVKAIKTYDELEDAIKSTEREIVAQEDDLLRQFPDKITDWTTTETVKWLWDQVDDVTRDYLDEWIELLKKYNKNDPAAMKELEMLQNTKNTEWLTRFEAKELARKLWVKLSKKFYNSNDELRNSMSAESYEQIRRWIQNAVRDRLPDQTLRNLDIEYSNLKAFEWLTDDMAEKVNTLTQKIKNTWPFEKLWRKIGDAVNYVTGKSVKWLVEKFLPSNMWNKINNSIDMEIELTKNLKELVRLNGAIDTLNNTLNSSASKSAITTALRKFANVVEDVQKVITPTVATTATKGVEAAANETYNELLDK